MSSCDAARLILAQKEIRDEPGPEVDMRCALLIPLLSS